MKKILTLILLGISLNFHAATTDSEKTWVSTWAASAEYAGQGDQPKESFSNRSIRQIIHVSIGGNQLRLQLSNEFSQQDVEIRSIYIADAAEGANINTKTACFLTFNGKRNVTIPAGKALFSDMMKYDLKPLQLLSITINYGEKVPTNMTSHRGSRTTSYIIKGASKPRKSFVPTEQLDHWYTIAALDVMASADTPCIAVLGNSITDGRGSTTNHQNRWTDRMAEAYEGKVAVLNEGIGGNAVLRGGLSEPAVKRFDRDIMSLRGVKTLVIFEGVNDIGGSRGNSEQVAKDLTEAYKKFTEQAHAAGIKVYLATITPFQGNGYFTPFHEAARQVVNEWIRTSGVADGVIDFDELVKNPQKPTALDEKYSDDWLHLNPAGYEAMGRYAASIIK